VRGALDWECLAGAWGSGPGEGGHENGIVHGRTIFSGAYGVGRLRELNAKCPKAMESYTKCMDYYSNEFELCRKEQREFEASCPL
jgi:hypothetical protein